VKSRDELLYDLIFSESGTHLIDVSEYIRDIYNYEEFVSEIKEILKKSKVVVLKSSILLDSRTAMWELKIKK
jgi:protein associated with RNAse G/E